MQREQAVRPGEPCALLQQTSTTRSQWEDSGASILTWGKTDLGKWGSLPSGGPESEPRSTTSRPPTGKPFEEGAGTWGWFSHGCPGCAGPADATVFRASVVGERPQVESAASQGGQPWCGPLWDWGQGTAHSRDYRKLHRTLLLDPSGQEVLTMGMGEQVA